MSCSLSSLKLFACLVLGVDIISNYLITGCAGFIGSNIARELLARGERVTGIDNFITGRVKNIEGFSDRKDFQFKEGDINNNSVLKDAMEGQDYVLHQAAIPSVPRSIELPIDTAEANIMGTLSVLEAAKESEVKKVVYASSSSVYGPSEELPKKENMPTNPVSPYALTKYAGERYTQLFSEIYGLPTVSLRYFNVFGPRQDLNSEYSAVIPKFINEMLQDNRPPIYGDGEQSRDFTFVKNVVEANILAAKSSASGEVFNVACGDRFTVNRLVERLNEILETSLEAKHLDPRKGDVRHSHANIAKAKKHLGYEPEVDFKEGLQKTVEWYQGDR